MLVDPPHSAWYRQDEQQPPTAAALRARDVATARALQAYLATRTATPVRTTVTTSL